MKWNLIIENKLNNWIRRVLNSNRLLRFLSKCGDVLLAAGGISFIINVNRWLAVLSTEWESLFNFIQFSQMNSLEQQVWVHCRVKMKSFVYYRKLLKYLPKISFHFEGFQGDHLSETFWYSFLLLFSLHSLLGFYNCSCSNFLGDLR